MHNEMVKIFRRLMEIERSTFSGVNFDTASAILNTRARELKVDALIVTRRWLEIYEFTM
jgi:hypothetical protein